MLRLRKDPPSLAGNPLPGDPDGRVESDVLIVGGDATPGLVVISKAGIPFTWEKRKGYGYTGAWLIFTGQDLAEFDTVFTIIREDEKVVWDAWAKKNLTPPVKPQNPNLGASRAAAQANLDAVLGQVNAISNSGASQSPQQKATLEAQLAQAQARAASVGATSPFLPNIPQPKALSVSNPILADLGIKQIVPKFVGQWVAGTGASKGKWTKTVSWYQFKPPVTAIGRPSAGIPDVKKKDPTADDAVQLQIRSKLQDIQERQARIAQLRGLK